MSEYLYKAQLYTAGELLTMVDERDKRIEELEGDLKWSEELNDRRLQDVRNRDKRIEELESALRQIDHISWGYDGDCGALAIVDKALEKES